MRLSWDEAKNRANRKKHGVSFEEAAELFQSGTDYLEIYDEDHSDEEDRFIAIGPVSTGLLLVVWTEQDENTGRIISARRATRRERQFYHSHVERM